MKTYIIIILTLLVFSYNILANNTELPDSILTIEHTYYYILSDPEKAQKIMEELKTRKLHEPWELDWCQADLYYNTGKYRLALYYFERVSKYNEVKKKPQLYMGLLSTMMECYRMNNNIQEAQQTAINVIHIAKDLNNKSEIGRAYMFMGLIAAQQRNKELADEYFSSAERSLVESQNIEYLYHFNLSLGNLMCEEKNYEQAYGYIKKAEKNLKHMEENKEDLLMPEGQINYEQGRLYALASEILEKSNNTKEARHYYTKFMASPCAEDSRSKIYIVPYLLEKGYYKTALSISHERIEILRLETDTIGEDMSAAINYLMQAYEMSGDKVQALAISKQAVSLANTIRIKDRENTALELATIYNVQEKEALITRQKADLQKKNVWLYCSLTIILLCLSISIMTIKNMRSIKEKNLAMVKQIREMQFYRKKLNILQNEAIINTETGTYEQLEISTSGKLTPKEIFAITDQKIRHEKLYLNPNLTRDDLVDLLSVRRLDFIQAINEYSGMNFTDYINSLRLEESLKLLEIHKKKSMEVIAEMSGFGSVRSFYRQFKNKYKMLPSEYRKIMKCYKH